MGLNLFSREMFLVLLAQVTQYDIDFLCLLWSPAFPPRLQQAIVA